MVSEMGKGRARPDQVRIEETNESEPLMMCRKRIHDVETMVESFPWDKRGGRPAYCLRGIRHESGVKSIQALVGNVGTCHSDVKGEAQVEAP